eukprot:14791854-Alexandrium_andersonii.AAC.1
MQSAVRPMPVSGAIRLNPQSAMRKMQKHRLTRSSLELRGPRNGLKNRSPKLPRVAFCTFFLAQIPNPPTTW